jgi:hypothetical protein
MNRHVVPSMLLSVLIVCFFAVILFERDSPRKSHGNDRAVTGKKTGVERLPSAPHGTDATPESPRPADGKQEPEAEKKPEQGKRQATAEPTASPVKQVGAGSSSAQTASGAATQHEPARRPQVASEPSTSKTTRPTPLPAKEGATRSSAFGGADSSPPKTTTHEPAADSGPQHPFTAVRQGETLRDVAIRVYGSADDLDSLWRANRDVLPRKDSPLAAGSVLRTPANARASRR